jgi:predicted DNA-binding protein (UPF0251 family)
MSKAKTRKQMAREYGVNRRTFYRMLKRADIKVSHGLITPEEQREIYSKLGDPALHSPNK